MSTRRIWAGKCEILKLSLSLAPVQILRNTKWLSVAESIVLQHYSPRLINISHFAKFAQGPRTDLVSRFRTSQPRSFGLTFRPRFYISRNSRRFQVGKKQIGALGPAPCTEFRCASCWHSHLNRLPTF